MCGQGTVRWAQLPYWQRVRKVQKTKTPGKTNLPVIAKPENGVGAADTYTIKNADDLKHFFATKPEEAYVCEEFIIGDICSYDAISDAAGEPLFESMTVWPPSIADIVNQDLDLAYYTHSVDVYQIWADMVTTGKRIVPEPEKEYFCAYASRKDGKQYVHTYEEIMERYGNAMKMCERMPEMMVRTMGNQMYTVRLEEEEQVFEFIRFVHEQKA